MVDSAWRTVFKNRRVGHSRLSGNLFSLDLLTDSEEGKQMDVKSSPPRLPLCNLWDCLSVARLKWEASLQQRKGYDPTHLLKIKNANPLI